MLKICSLIIFFVFLAFAAYNIAAIKVIIDHYPLNRSASLKALRYPANSILLGDRHLIFSITLREIYQACLPAGRDN